MSIGVCALMSGKVVATAAALFTLSWTHSVEKTEWRETWQVEKNALVLVEASVRGSGAGMDPGEGAELKDGYWVWTPDLAPQASVKLAASGATISPWSLCDKTGCSTLGRDASDGITLQPCDSGKS